MEIIVPIYLHHHGTSGQLSQSTVKNTSISNSEETTTKIKAQGSKRTVNIPMCSKGELITGIIKSITFVISKFKDLANTYCIVWLSNWHCSIKSNFLDQQRKKINAVLLCLPKPGERQHNYVKG